MLFSIAHEITHAFDDSGINYDRDGNSAQLYDNKTLDGFMTEANCLRDQYFKYSIAGEKSNLREYVVVYRFNPQGTMLMGI